MRYLLPIYPTMALMAAYGLVWLLDWSRRAAPRIRAPKRLLRFPIVLAGRWVRLAAVAVVLIVVLGTAFWAIAFTRIYTRPMTRIAASRWIYDNIPSGSAVSFEMWDDPLPLNIDGHIGGYEYNHIQMDLYWEIILLV